jgi:hypothetical protein
MIETFGQDKAHAIESAEAVADNNYLHPLGVELFFIGSGNPTYLPVELTTNVQLKEQAGERRSLYSQLHHLFTMIPVDKDVDTAINEKKVERDTVAKLYTDLATFMQTDRNNARILLYLPFELLPDMQSPSDSSQYEAAKQTFGLVYKQSWKTLLSESDIRANFVDGDVGEPGMGDLPRVRKAAHLLAGLLTKGILTSEDIFEELAHSEEEELVLSLIEGLAIAHDYHLLDENTRLKIRDYIRRKTLNPQLETVFQHPSTLPNDEKGNESGMSLGKITKTLEEKLAKIEKNYAPDSAYSKQVSEKRIIWEKGVKIDKAIAQAANNLLILYTHGEITIADIIKFIEQPETAYSTAGLKSIFQIGEEAIKSKRDVEQIIKQSWDCIQNNVHSLDTKTADVIIGGLSRWEKLGLVNNSQVKKIGVSTVDLSNPFPIEGLRHVDTDLTAIREQIIAVADDLELSPYVFPFLITFGSRVKGYAKSGADIDLGMFFKPDTPWKQREQIYQKLTQAVPQLPQLYELPQFWINEKNGSYTFRNVPTENDNIVLHGPQLIHFIFGSVWFGDTEQATKLSSDLVKQYINLDRFGDQKEAVRFQFLRRLEMDFLQFRLMHKGYPWLYPDRRSKKNDTWRYGRL